MARFLRNDTGGWVNALNGAGAAARGILAARDKKFNREQVAQQNERAQAADLRAQSADQRDQEAHDLRLKGAQAELAAQEEQAALRRKQAAASLQFDLFRLDTLTGRNRARPITGPVSNAISAGNDFMQSERVRAAIEGLPEDRRQQAISFMEEGQRKRQLQQETVQVAGEIQSAMEPPPGVEPWLDPETGAQMIQDLQDVNRPDVGPQEMRAVLEKQRNFVRALRVARSTFSANYTHAQSLAASPEPPPELGISQREWMDRRRAAKNALEDWGTSWSRWDPDEKYQEVMDILRKTPRHDSIEVRQNVLKMLADDPNYQMAATQEERNAYRDATLEWVMGGGLPPAAAQGQQPEQGPRVGPLQTFQDGPIGYSHGRTTESPVPPDVEKSLLSAALEANPAEAVKRVLDSAGIDPRTMPMKLRKELVKQSERAPEINAENAQRKALSDYQKGMRDIDRIASEAARGNGNVASPGALPKTGGVRPFSTLSETEKRMLANILKRDPKRARALVEKAGIDPASLPLELRRLAAGE